MSAIICFPVPLSRSSPQVAICNLHPKYKIFNVFSLLQTKIVVVKLAVQKEILAALQEYIAGDAFGQSARHRRRGRYSVRQRCRSHPTGDSAPHVSQLLLPEMTENIF